ncbi:MAG TPA: MFS transporter [Rhizomicrobium sp.]|jgi:MFS family permease
MSETDPEQESPERHAAVIAEEYGIARAYQSATTPAERKRAFAILFLSLLCMGAGQSVINPILQALGPKLGLSPVQVTSIFACSALIWIFSSTFWGVRSDIWGRKPVMLLGLIAFAVSFAAFAGILSLGLGHAIAASLTFPLLIASRCIYGTFGSGTSAAAQAYVADRTTPRERLSGVAVISMAFALGTTAGPVVGATLTYVNLLAPFYFISIMALASAAAIWFLLPERTAPQSQALKPSTLRWYEPRMFPFVGFGVVLSLVGSIPLQILGFFLHDILHTGASDVARLGSIGFVISALSALFAQFVVVRRFRGSSRWLVAAGVVIAALSNVLFLLAHNFAMVAAAMSLSGLGLGIARPGFTAGASLSVAPHEQGAVAGLIGTAGAAGFIFGPVIGWLYEMSPSAPYACGAVVMLMLLVAQFLSPVLYRAGDIPPEVEAAEERAESSVPEG